MKLGILEPLEARFVAAGFRQLLPVAGAVEPHLRGALEDSLEHPGSLVRAEVVYAILSRHGVAAAAARRAAIAIEYFHTASLLFDDLPCMDDARERRGRRCPHLVHGEAAAVLAALALINRGYGLLWGVLATLPLERRLRASELVTTCLGVDGILDGQARDLHFAAAASGRGPAAEVRRIAEGKTVSLIRLTLVLPAVMAGAGAAAVARLERLSTVWGLSYQILDDFKDGLMSACETGKSSGRDEALGRPNLPGALGTGEALDILGELLDEGRRLLAAFGGGERWRALGELQALLERQQRDVGRRLPAAACA